MHSVSDNVLTAKIDCKPSPALHCIKNNVKYIETLFCIILIQKIIYYKSL